MVRHGLFKGAARTQVRKKERATYNCMPMSKNQVRLSWPPLFQIAWHEPKACTALAFGSEHEVIRALVSDLMKAKRKAQG